MIVWLSMRLLDGMMAEEKCWKIYRDFDSGCCTVSDLDRYVQKAPSLAALDLDSFESIRFNDTEVDNFDKAKSYVRFRVARAGLIHMLKFWRTWA